jgi:hypothetical protein
MENMAEVQRGCELPCADPQSIAVYRAEIGVVATELGLSPTERKAAEQNYIPNGVPRKRAVKDTSSAASRKFEAQAVARLLADPHISPQAQQELAGRMQGIARALGGLQLVDGAGASITLGEPADARASAARKNLPRVQLPIGFKAFSAEPPMLAIHEPDSLIDRIESSLSILNPLPRDKIIPVNILQRVPDGCLLLESLSGQGQGTEDCTGDQVILNHELGDGNVNIVHRSLPAGTNGEIRTIGMRSFFNNTAILGRTDLNISDDRSFVGSEAEAFTVYHEMRHIRTHKEIEVLFHGQYPPEAAMTDELITNDAEMEQYVKKHPNILTMDPPENQHDLDLWARSRVRAGTIFPENYGTYDRATRLLNDICRDKPSGKACGGVETIHRHLRILYANSHYPSTTDPGIEQTLRIFLKEQSDKQDEFYSVIRDNTQKSCEENPILACERRQ